jgi:hypothetical protein
MNRQDRNAALNLLANFPDDPSVVPDRSLNDAQLMLEGGLLALDHKLYTMASDMLRRSKELAGEAFAAYLRTDICLAREANDILGKVEEGLRDLNGMLRK